MKLRDRGMSLAGALVTGAMILLAQGQRPSVMLPENAATQVSDHVYVIMGFPNVGIVVGNRATLVVDTGLGPKNGAVVTRQAEKLAKGPNLYLTTTHFHPEHAGGEPGFPARTVLIRPAAQQEEMERRGAQFLDMFRGFSPENRELLADVKLRPPDITFDKELKLDLGGLTVLLLWLGGGHTKGDELIFVEGDQTLLSGDIVEKNMAPSMPNEDSSAKHWLASLDTIEALHPVHVVPDHGELGDGSLIGKERAFLLDLQTRALESQQKGVSAEDAGKALVDVFKAKYPDYGNLNAIPNAVKRIYFEGR
jgi:glyoxylase-like metal-dependent hydrolase (beta-lactamase superfamily II)